VLGAYGYFWLNTPEYLTWWKRTVNTLIEKGCDMLSYPWGDRIESTVGNFGIWVQITLAILIFRYHWYRAHSDPSNEETLTNPARAARAPNCSSSMWPKRGSAAPTLTVYISFLTW
jgi:hypothetical protein